MLKKFILLIILLLTAAAGAIALPVDSVVNPTTGTLYAVNNNNSSIDIYSYNSSTNIWTKEESKTILLPSGAKCYGLAYNASSYGTKLFISVSASNNNDALYIYSLDPSSGLPITMREAAWDKGSEGGGLSPLGIAVNPSGTRVYMADGTLGKIHYFDLKVSDGTWSHTDDIAAERNVFNIALKYVKGTNPSTSYAKLYVSIEDYQGKILIYKDSPSTEIEDQGEITGLAAPTSLKLYNNRLYAAVNGNDGVDIKVYDTENNDVFVANIASGINGNYGWTGFDIANSDWLIFKKAKNVGETQNGLYKINLDVNQIKGGGTFTADEIVGTSFIASDSVAIASNRKAIALTESYYGALQQILNNNYFPYNTAPYTPINLEMWAWDGTTKISDPVYINTSYYSDQGTTRTKLKFIATDPNGDPIKKVMVTANRLTPAPRTESYTYNEGEFTQDPDSTVTLTFPKAGADELLAGEWEWEAKTYDGALWTTVAAQYGNNQGVSDFVVDTTAPFISSSDPADGAGNVPLTKSILINFSDVMLRNSFSLVCTPAADLSSAYDWSTDNKSVTISLATNKHFAEGTLYTLDIHAQDKAGNPLSATLQFSTTVVPTNLRQYAVKSGYELSPAFCINYNYSLTEGSTKFKINLDTPNASDVQKVRIVYRTPGEPNWAFDGRDYDKSKGEFSTNGSTISLTFRGFPTEGPKEWGAAVSYDGVNFSDPDQANYNNDTGKADIVIDTTLPNATFNPVSGKFDVGVGDPIIITFSKTMETSSFLYTCTAKDAQGADVSFSAFTKSWSSDKKILTLSHSQLFAYETLHNFTIDSAKDTSGNDVNLWNLTDPPHPEFLKTTFTTIKQPLVSKIYPNAGPINTDIEITIKGSKFDTASGKTTVAFDAAGPTIQAITVKSSTEITASVKSPTPGEYHVIVSVNGVSCPASTANRFTFSTSNPDGPPAKIVDFNADDEENQQSTLTWTNPSNGDLKEILVLRSTTGYPALDDPSATRVHQDYNPEPGAKATVVDDDDVYDNAVNPYYYAVYSCDTFGGWNPELDYTTPEVNADTAYPGIPPKPVISGLSPSPAYAGQTVVIKGTNLLSRSKNSITLSGKLPIYPTSWTQYEIIFAVPSFPSSWSPDQFVEVKTGNPSPAQRGLYVKPGAVVIDDIEGGSVGTDKNTWTHYFASETGITPNNDQINTDGPVIEASSPSLADSKKGMRVKYADATSSLWGGYLSNVLDLSGMDSIKFQFKGDGSNNNVTLWLTARKDGVTSLINCSKSVNLKGTAWETANFKLSDFKLNNQAVPTEIWQKINGYYFYYNSSNGNNNNGTYQYIDNLQAFDSKTVAPKIETIYPAQSAYYPGQSIAIMGKQFSTGYVRSITRLTIGGINVNPTYWGVSGNSNLIWAAIPSTLPAGPANIVVTNYNGFDSAPLPINIDNSQLVVDDFEGGVVGQGNYDYDGDGKKGDSSYFAFDKYDPADTPPKLSTSYPDYEINTNPANIYSGSGYASMKILYSYGSRRGEDHSVADPKDDWGGGWSGKLANTIDLSKMNTFKFHLKWDGSQNDMNLIFRDIDGTETEVNIPNAILKKCADFNAIIVHKNNFVPSPLQRGTNPAMSWEAITNYNFAYKSTGESFNSHYIDELQAIQDDVLVTQATIARKEDANLSIVLTWETSPADKAVDIYTLNGDFTTDASKWNPEFTNITGNIQYDQGEVGSGTAKYYKIVPAGHVFSNELLTSEVLGKFDWEVVEGNNFVSIPLIPSGSTMADIIGNQINPAQDKESADVIYYYNASNNQWMDAWRRIESNYLVWDGDMSSMEADRGYFVTIKSGSKAKNISVVGKVFLGDSRSIDLYKFSNMVGSVFPYKVDLNNSGLASILTASTLPVEADKIYHYDAKAQAWQVSYLDSSGKFLSQNLNYLEPGKGYYINNQDAANPETWVYTKP